MIFNIELLPGTGAQIKRCFTHIPQMADASRARPEIRNLIRARCIARILEPGFPTDRFFTGSETALRDDKIKY